MLTVRPAGERGRTRLDWLDSFHTFSFNQYYDPRHMGFRSLRVINDDFVSAGAGFGAHPHRDMEILTWVVDGALEHRDSTGGGGVVRPGDIQRMSAGTGVTHSEFNQSAEEPVHLLQVWLLPERRGIDPEYEQRNYPAVEREGRLRLVASKDGRDGSVTIHQDAALHAALFAPGQKAEHKLASGRHAWLHVASGAVSINGMKLSAGDGIAASDEPSLVIEAAEKSEVLLFDLA